MVIIDYKMPKVSKKPKTAESAPAAPAAPSTPAHVPVEVQSTEQVEVQSLTDQFNDLLGQLSTLRTQLTSVTSQVRVLARRSDRELKQAQKASKKKRKAGNKEPSGFTKPAKISSELAAFLGKDEGTEMARTEVTKELQKYILSHKLQDPANRRNINPDTKLRKLLGMKKSDSLTYFNLQKWMKPHFKTATQVV